MLWYYHDDDVPGPAADVELTLSGFPEMSGEPEIQQFRIDADHSNATTVWQQMGSPEKPTDEQLAKLKEAGQLATIAGPNKVPIQDKKQSLLLKLPRQGVSLLVIQWPNK